MADIFVSYAEEDRDLVRALVSAIEVSTGWSVWWDRRIPTGKTWRAVLDTALADMKCMVVVWSAASVESEWVIEEADEGKSRGVLLPILVGAIRPPRGFREIQTLDFSAWDRSPNAACVNTLVGDIRGFIGDVGKQNLPSTDTHERSDRTNAFPALKREPEKQQPRESAQPAPKGEVSAELARSHPHGATPQAVKPPSPVIEQTLPREKGHATERQATLKRDGGRPQEHQPPELAPPATKDEVSADLSRSHLDGPIPGAALPSSAEGSEITSRSAKPTVEQTLLLEKRRATELNATGDSVKAASANSGIRRYGLIALGLIALVGGVTVIAYLSRTPTVDPTLMDATFESAEFCTAVTAAYAARTNTFESLRGRPAPDWKNTYVSNQPLASAKTCYVVPLSSSYQCVWNYRNNHDAKAATSTLTNAVKQCIPGGTVIVADDPFHHDVVSHLYNLASGGSILARSEESSMWLAIFREQLAKWP